MKATIGERVASVRLESMMEVMACSETDWCNAGRSNPEEAGGGGAGRGRDSTEASGSQHHHHHEARRGGGKGEEEERSRKRNRTMLQRG